MWSQRLEVVLTRRNNWNQTPKMAGNLQKSLQVRRCTCKIFLYGKFSEDEIYERKILVTQPYRILIHRASINDDTRVFYAPKCETILAYVNENRMHALAMMAIIIAIRTGRVENKTYNASDEVARQIMPKKYRAYLEWTPRRTHEWGLKVYGQKLDCLYRCIIELDRLARWAIAHVGNIQTVRCALWCTMQPSRQEG